MWTKIKMKMEHTKIKTNSKYIYKKFNFHLVETDVLNLRNNDNYIDILKTNK